MNNKIDYPIQLQSFAGVLIGGDLDESVIEVFTHEEFTDSTSVTISVMTDGDGRYASYVSFKDMYDRLLDEGDLLVLSNNTKKALGNVNMKDLFTSSLISDNIKTFDEVRAMAVERSAV